MKHTTPRPIEHFIYHLLLDDRDIQRIIENWNIERAEVKEILVSHYREMGIFEVLPLHHTSMIKEDVIFQLKFNPELLKRKEAIQIEIERVKARQRR